MTAIVGIKCEDGVVIGADSATTFTAGTMRTIEQQTDRKIQIVAGRVMVAGTGQVGLGQRFCHVVQKAHDEKLFQGDAFEVVKGLCRRGIEDFVSTSAPKGQYGALVAFPVGEKPYLCEFSVVDFQPELKDNSMWYCSMGSAQPILDPFLGLFRKVFWQDGPPTVSEGVFAAIWALQLAIELNPGGVGGDPTIAALTRQDGKFTARHLPEEELAEHLDAVQDAEDHLRGLRERHRGRGGEVLPEAPG
jgi:hypothetical protein